MSIIRILHQTTTKTIKNVFNCSCLLSGFYIKPQLCFIGPWARGVVYYQDSTSNHNYGFSTYMEISLSIIRILHQTTTNTMVLVWLHRLSIIRILHQTTTTKLMPVAMVELSIIRILHQTTTNNIYGDAKKRLSIIRILHQTTTRHYRQIQN